MSYRKIEMYSLFCDGCGKMYIDSNDFCAWHHDGLDDIQSDGWHVGDQDKHYCGSCHTIDDNDVVHLNQNPAGNE